MGVCVCVCALKSLRALTSFDAYDGPPEAQGDSEALPDIDHPIKQTVLCVQVRNHALLLLQWLQTQTHRQMSLDADVEGAAAPPKRYSL